MRAHLTDEFDVVQGHQPVGVIVQDNLAGAEIQQAAHLTDEAVDIVLDDLGSQDGSHIGAAGRIPYVTGSPAHEGNGTNTRLLHVAHDHDLDEMAGVQAVRSRIKTHIKGRPLPGQIVLHLFFVCNLRDVTAFKKRVENIFHGGNLLVG